MKIHLLSRGFFTPKQRAALKTLATHVVQSEESETTELAVKLTDDAGITKINARFLGREWPTDVISFPDGEKRPDGSLPLGDIVISIETARRNAKRYGRSAFEETRLLVVHGILHLLGYSHKKDGRAMKRLERKYLKN